MSKTKEQKVAFKDSIGDSFKNASAVVFAEYQGVSANDLAQLRKELRKVDCSFTVVKNTLAKLASEENEDYKVLAGESLKGPLGLAYMNSDIAAAAKAMLEFAKKNDKLKIKGGVLEGKLVNLSSIKAIADLPSKEVLLSNILSSMVSPHRGLMTVINGVGTNIVRVINAIKEKKQ
ncbi:MAG: 50S ribosomal protein L10 [Zetaproteobacteria bacterium]|nr:50S ribosomal protein L10 [Pseudobdellovibrionaceae bacterium]|tara:strand:- start:264 stop:791 length:528 start_codon:yes stop_codon:yes gene_type:complete